MKWLSILLVLLFTMACAPETQDRPPEISPPYADEKIDCPAERPEVCPQVYDPVCAPDGATYSNGCEACTYPDVAWYEPGEC